MALLGEDGTAGRVMSTVLVKSDIVPTGIEDGPDLVGVSREDRFAESFRAVRGTVDAELDLGF